MNPVNPNREIAQDTLRRMVNIDEDYSTSIYPSPEAVRLANDVADVATWFPDFSVSEVITNTIGKVGLGSLNGQHDPSTAALKLMINVSSAIAVEKQGVTV